jgi:excisionase family DNA binding protein
MANMSSTLTTLILCGFVVLVNNQSEDYLTPAEAARIFGVTTTTLLRWVRSGRLQAVRLPSGQHRYRKEDVAKLTSGGAPA